MTLSSFGKSTVPSPPGVTAISAARNREGSGGEALPPSSFGPGYGSIDQTMRRTLEGHFLSAGEGLTTREELEASLQAGTAMPVVTGQGSTPPGFFDEDQEWLK